MSSTNERRHLVVQGIVQGVGFRPFVYRLARELGLAGWVRNVGSSVEIEVEGDVDALDRFIVRLDRDAPPLARVQQISVDARELMGDGAFVIAESEESEDASVLVSPDIATCRECLAELFDPGDRRYRYPFINCTNCGPRFTIIKGVPYDRPLTTMAGFPMCARCQAEYDDPADRRFHAQPNACPDCGPSVSLVDVAGRPVALGGAIDPVAAAAAALRAGSIVAIKGIGGFHLACLADDEAVVKRLRGRKNREARPFALMARDLEAARGLVELDAEEERVLTGPERPIVLARRRPGAPVADAVAPGLRELGVMLPYSPLHHILVADVGAPLVMTSGNRSDEPIAYRNDEAVERLAGIADLFLLHDRPIEVRVDDSVVRVVTIGRRRRLLVLRRSRGYVPTPVELPVPTPRPLLACGGQLKNTFCIAAGSRAWLGQHIGDLENYEALVSFRAGIDHFERLFGVTPEIVVHDLHPDYLSTGYALDRTELTPIGVQHHHAHLAACLAEHSETGPVIGAIFDGTGYGSDGTVWGGEILFGDLEGFRRIGHLWPVRMPGGEAAVREPWRMACAWLAESLHERPPLPAWLAGRVDAERWDAVARLVHRALASPVTTSVGRFFDAVAALCGLGVRVSYEGQAAITLEAVADPREEASYPIPLVDEAAGLVMDGREAVRAIVADLARDTPPGIISARFHNGVAAATARVCMTAAERHGVDRIVLSGGVFQNVLLLERTAARLVDARLRVLVPERIPPNDGGIALGQAAIAARRLAGSGRA